MSKIVVIILGLSGWRRHALAFFAGACSVLGQAPFHFWPILAVTLPVLALLLDSVRRQQKQPFVRAAITGWFFGFGYFLIGLYWIGAAFLVEAEKFALFLPLAVSLLPAGLALFYATACSAAMLLWRHGAGRIVSLALFLTLAEWLRGHIFTGFPWNLLGYVLAGSDALLQWASIFGAYGLTFFTILIMAAPAALWPPARHGRFATDRLTLVFPAGMAGLLAAAGLWGSYRLAAADVKPVQDVRLRIVQPNIPQKKKWAPGNENWIFDRYLELSAQKSNEAPRGLADVTHLIWPESAVPFLLARSKAALARLDEMMPQDLRFITGALRFEDADATGRTKQPRKAYNSLFVFDGGARIEAVYDKMHLVPFGEYLPFQNVMEAIGLRQLTQIIGGFESGRGPRFLRAGKAPPFSPLICYEIIFSGDVAERDARPGWLLNVTNDAWYGVTTGPYQHLHQARIRAVEEGLPVVRAANTGVSAIIDPYGRVVKRLRLNRRGIIDGALPRALEPTYFVGYGKLLLVVVLVFALILAVLSHTSRKKDELY